MKRGKKRNPATLHERIAAALGWTVAQTQSFSLPALRDLVRPVSPALASEISGVLAGGSHVARRRKNFGVFQGSPVGSGPLVRHNPKKRSGARPKFSGGISLIHNATGQWLVMWGDREVLRVFSKKEDALDYIASLGSKRTNPLSPGNEAEATELHLYISNDGRLYEQKLKPTYKNLITKMARGTYNREAAVKLFMYTVDEGAKRYAREIAGGGVWNVMFSRAVRLDVARALRDYFEAEARLGHFNRYLPKKYQTKNPKRRNGGFNVGALGTTLINKRSNPKRRNPLKSGYFKVIISGGHHKKGEHESRVVQGTTAEVRAWAVRKAATGYKVTVDGPFATEPRPGWRERRAANKRRRR